MFRNLLLIGLMLIGSGQNLFGQNDYYMVNGTVYDCKGNFFDSDNGIKTGDYAHNEDLIFRICVKNASSITLVFQSFCTEKDEDYMIIYDGKDTFANKLSGKISGTTNPGTFSSTDSCLTIYYHTDASVACDGWRAYWTTKVKPLADPKFVRIPKASCNATQLGVRFDQKFNCDSINAANFSVTGIVNPNITGVTAVGCDSKRETDSFTLSLSTPLNRSGRYSVAFDAVKYDECDSAWQLHADTVFFITDCPIYVELFADPDTVCSGTCTDITAQVTGGDSTKYVFNWTPSLTGTFGPINYCPTTSGWLKLIVTDGTSVPGSDSVWIEVVNPPVARADTTLCQSNPPFNLTATPVGGTWRGKGITDSINGVFNPQLAGAGVHKITYHYAGCSDDVNINVRAMDAGLPNAACPGTAAFMVTGFTPTGGTWTGPNIQSNGLFNPIDTGKFVVTYSWNGCVDTKEINVYPISTLEFDTTCQSTPTLQIPFSPIGGTWSGPGFINNMNGIFYPPRAGAGSKRLIYTMNGCRDTTTIQVISINARNDIIVCPDAQPITLQVPIPTGGVWKGVGITDTIAGVYDGSFIYGLGRTWYNDTLTYTANGCVDAKIVYVRQTFVLYDTLKFCIEDDSLFLDYNTTRRSPGGGVWTGPGMLGNYFNPARAGHGVHKTYYTAYGCVDSLIMVVHPKVNIQSDTTVCITDNPFFLKNDVLGGIWQGKGVTNGVTGYYSPMVANVGIHKIIHTSKKGCKDSLYVEVEAKPVVKLSGYDPVYCFKDSLFTLSGTPAGGAFTGSGVVGSSFRPKDAGTGTHKLRYQFGTPTCNSADSVYVNVSDTLRGQLTVDDDSLCFGENAVLTATASRGRGSGYGYAWRGSSSTSRTNFQMPNTSTWVVCTFSDGCSDPYTDSLFLNVFPKVEVTVASSPIQCYGTVGYAEALPRFPDPHKITWLTTPQRTNNRIAVPVSNTYRFRMENLNTKCFLDSGVFVLSYPRLKAHFITSPSPGHCLNPFNPVLSVINFTEGATSGTWDFGDGYTEAYDPDVNPVHRYIADTNWYPIALRVRNEGGCVDSFFSHVCLDDSVYVFLPSAFSPGTDDINDQLHVLAAGVTEFELIIFDRWGERVFATTDTNFAWDGSYNGKPMPNGVLGFRLIYKGKNTTRKAMTGTIQLIR